MKKYNHYINDVGNKKIQQLGMIMHRFFHLTLFIDLTLSPI